MTTLGISPDGPRDNATDAERACDDLEYKWIGWLLANAPGAVNHINDCRSVRVFLLPVHRRIFDAIVAAQSEGGDHSVAAIYLKLHDDAVLNEGGGFEYLRTCADSAPTMANERDGSRQFNATLDAYKKVCERAIFDAKTNEVFEAWKRRAPDILRQIADLGVEAREIDQRLQFRPRLSMTSDEFLAQQIAPRTKLLAPWLLSGGLAMVHAARGVGKTHFALGVAVACATGGEFLGWRAEMPRRVLYVDGEMSGSDMQQRIRAALAYAGGCPPDNFRLITPDMLPLGGLVPNLQTPEGQDVIKADLQDREVVILDSAATLFRTSEDPNSASTWLAPQEYILSLRRQGAGVLLADHDNKSGGNRGTSAKQDVLDTVIHLKLPSDYVSSQGARFEVHFEKHRGFYGKDAAPFETQLIEIEGRTEWVTGDASALEERVQEMKAAGYTDRKIREELGIGGSKLDRIKEKARSRSKG